MLDFIITFVVVLVSFCYFLKYRISSSKERKKLWHSDLMKDNPGKLKCELCYQKSIHQKQVRCTNINCRGKMIRIDNG